MALVRVPTLSDGGVTLRAHRDDDVEAVVEQSRDPLSVRWTRVPPDYTREDGRRFVREAMPGGWASDQEWGFAVEADGAFAGTVSLRNQGDGRAEVAYGAHPRARGTGTMERALRLLLAWGFAERDLRTVIWWAEAGNWPSRKLAWRLGFDIARGVVRQWQQHGDVLVDAWVGTLLRDDERLPRHAWLDVPVVEGRAVRLRPFRDDDLDRVVEACADERSAYWMGTAPVPFTREHGERLLRDRPLGMAEGTAVHWAVADPATDALLGAVSLRQIGEPLGPDVGYWTHPDARGRGVTTEALRLAARHAFVLTDDGGLGLPRLRLLVAEDNAASRHVAETAGFGLVGIERAATLCRDGLHDAAVYDLVPGDLRREPIGG